MLQKALMVLLWFPLTIGLLANSILLLSKMRDPSDIVSQSPVSHQTSYLNATDNPASVPGTGQVLGAHVVIGDGRALLLSQFMSNTPLAQYADLMVREADKYGLDFRLIPAIAMCESNLGHRIPSLDSFNAWGIAVYTGQLEGAKFDNWNQAIVWMAQYLHDAYVGRDIIDLRQIGAIYAPPSVAKGHSWANCVETFMKDIQ